MASSASMAMFLLFTFFFFIQLQFSLSLPTQDTLNLIRFMSELDAHGNLRPNWTTDDACSGYWIGIRCFYGRVTSIILPSLDLRGSIDSIRYFDQLRYLDLHDNHLNGSLSPLTSCGNLKIAYLFGNEFTGVIPPGIGVLERLLRLDLSDNNLAGEIPAGVSNLTNLITLHLQDNVFNGRIPDLTKELVHLTELNFSNNEFNGELPENMERRFGVASFSGNAGLCGVNSLLPHCSFTPNSPPAVSPNILHSNPTPIPGFKGLPLANKPRNGLSTKAIVAIVVGDAAVVMIIVICLTAYYFGRYHKSKEKIMVEKREDQNGSTRSRSPLSDLSDKDRTKLVFFERRRRFELEDLLKASAEMLGKGSLGTVYKAMLEDGSVLAVKRLKEAYPTGRKEFEDYMGMIGKIRHPNVVRLKAYYNAKEEKLLVYDYLPNGTLYSLLHGNRGPGRTPLDWTTRISMVLGAARGLARIHEEYASAGIPHGNIKSSNILLDKNGIACISDFGLVLLLNPIHATARLGGYRAPEQIENKRLSQKADVYGFGVLLLELLTGRVPAQTPSHEGVDLSKWVQSIVREEWTAEVFDVELLRYKNIEEELVQMLQIALACIITKPEDRPMMSEVVKMIEEIRIEQSPIREEWDDSRNSVSPSVTEDTLTSC